MEVQKDTYINAKAEQFREFIMQNNMNFFGAEEKKDELNTVIFRTELDLNGQRLPLLLFTDDSIYTVIKIRIIPCVTKEKSKEKLLVYINKMNASYKIFKYYITEEGDTVLDISLPCSKDFFDPRMVTAAIDLAMQHLGEVYADFMKLVWSDDVQ